MTLSEALKRSYAEGLGCAAVGDDTGSVYFLRRDGAGKMIVKVASPATRAKRECWEDVGSPCTLEALEAAYETRPLPVGVEPDFRPVASRSITTISDLLG